MKELELKLKELKEEAKDIEDSMWYVTDAITEAEKLYGGTREQVRIYDLEIKYNHLKNKKKELLEEIDILEKALEILSK